MQRRVKSGDWQEHMIKGHRSKEIAARPCRTRRTTQMKINLDSPEKEDTL
jgi:hypothetical protein